MVVPETRTYFGITIYPAGRNNGGLKYETVSPRLRADSLFGIKRLIRESLRKGRKEPVTRKF